MISGPPSEGHDSSVGFLLKKLLRTQSALNGWDLEFQRAVSPSTRIRIPMGSNTRPGAPRGHSLQQPTGIPGTADGRNQRTSRPSTQKNAAETNRAIFGTARAPFVYSWSRLLTWRQLANLTWRKITSHQLGIAGKLGEASPAYRGGNDEAWSPL